MKKKYNRLQSSFLFVSLALTLSCKQDTKKRVLSLFHSSGNHEKQLSGHRSSYFGGQWMRKKERHRCERCSHQVCQEIQDRVLSLPTKLRWVDTQGRGISAFQEPPLQGKALECICSSHWRRVWAWIHLCWMFSHLLQLWRGDYPRIFPTLNGDKGRCASLWWTHWERGAAAKHCVPSWW